MNKKFLLATLSMLVLLTGCESEPITINVDNQSELSGTIIGGGALIAIKPDLYYDSTTRIVYWWNGSMHNRYATTPTPYYAPNGLPYRYNPDTNTLEEIKGSESDA